MTNTGRRVYPSHRAASMPRLAEVPSHWSEKQIRFVADLRVSNVDKKSVEGQEAVRLCNYTDVYYNERISARMSFMEATATQDQIRRFSLRRGDVLLTKDSETADDIGVPSVVVDELPGVLCGYHIAVARPSEGVYGPFLARALSVSPVRDQFFSAANGVTRFGLARVDIGAAVVPVPPLSEQRAIAAFLDCETARIDALIEKKRRLIELLQEKRAAVISHAVTQGLDIHVRQRPSGIDWLGNVPHHWTVSPLTKYLESIVDYRGATPQKVDDGVFLVTTRNIRSGKIDYGASQEYIDPADYELTMRRGRPRMGDVLFTMEAPLGQTANVDREDVALAQRIVKFRPRRNMLDPYFLKYWIMGSYFQQDVSSYSTGSTAQGIKASKLGYLKVALPPIDEQLAIVHFLDADRQRGEQLEGRIGAAVDALIEYRSALIAAAVTGQIDVREAA